jgi:predicted NAD/FAD-dependent oxidoreductase
MNHRVVDVAVIGAGVAGLAAANAASQRGFNVLVLDKSRGVGGRAATRRIHEQPVDHGAQFFTCRSEEFANKVREWIDAGLCREWIPSPWLWRESGVSRSNPASHPRFCCPEGMTALSKHESKNLELLRETQIVSGRPSAEGWELLTKGGETISARTVISTAPAPQTLGLFGSHIRESNPVRTISYAPCFSFVMELHGVKTEWSALQCEHPVISWIANDATRRDSTTPNGLFVIHTSPEFSQANLERTPAELAGQVSAALVEICGPEFSEAEVVHAHRWRYAKVRNPLPGSCLEIAENLLFAGDAFHHANVEAAWLSGRAAGTVVVNV